MEGCSNYSRTSSPAGMSLLSLILLPPTKVYRGSMSWHRCIRSETLATASKKTLSRARFGENPPPLRRTHTRTRPMPSAPAVKIVVPDDFPPALTGSVAEAPLQKLGQVRVFTERGADQEQTLIERIGDPEV